MTSPTPTPAHQAFREKRAQQFANPAGVTKLPLVVEVKIRHDVEKFLAGMAAEHEVAKLMGSIDAYADIADITKGEYLGIICRDRSARLEAQLNALLEGK